MRNRSGLWAGRTRKVFWRKFTLAFSTGVASGGGSAARTLFRASKSINWSFIHCGCERRASSRVGRSAPSLAELLAAAAGAGLSVPSGTRSVTRPWKDEKGRRALLPFPWPPVGMRASSMAAARSRPQASKLTASLELSALHSGGSASRALALRAQGTRSVELSAPTFFLTYQQGYG